MLAGPCLAVIWDPLPADFVKTNGDMVTIGSIMVPIDSKLNNDEYKTYKWRCTQMYRLQASPATNHLELFTAAAWQLANEYPDRPNGYEALAGVLGTYQYLGKSEAGRALAEKLITSQAPEKYKIWTRGWLKRVNSLNQTIDLHFTAFDGREVDLAKMRGKVVLVDFWGTHCEPCVAELPRVKAAYETYHAQGLEIIGISSDTAKVDLEKFLQHTPLPWPIYFDGKGQLDNAQYLAFGVDGIPYMFLVDKQGRLRFDMVRADDQFRPRGNKSTMAEKIKLLLAE